MLKKFFDRVLNFYIFVYKKSIDFFKFLFVEKNEDGKSDTSATIKSIFIALILAVVVRSFLYEPFYIPSGSMKPGLKEGDFIIVSKYTFGYTKYSFPFAAIPFNGRIFFNNKPERGDVLVFRLPNNPKINYIKRLVGLPNDKVQVKDGILYINDEAMPREYIGKIEEYDDDKSSEADAYKETINNKEFTILEKVYGNQADNTPFFNIPEGYYFFVGDNRDNSIDSRFEETGLIPEENLIGEAKRIIISSEESLFKFWRWPFSIRFNRFFKKIK